jgi:hypothetical protein
MASYTCPSCVEGDHGNCTRNTCICICDDGMSLAQGYLWKQRAQVATDALAEVNERRIAIEDEAAYQRSQRVKAEAENERLRTRVQEAAALLDFEANLGDPKRAPALREVVKQLTEALEG